MAPIDLELFQEHTRGRSMVEVLLRGHLWLENALIDLIEAEVANPQPLKKRRISFFNRVNLAESLGLLVPSDVATLMKINSIRNRLAHNLHGEPTLGDISALEKGLSHHQRVLARAMLDSNEFHEKSTESDPVVRLAIAILALLIDIESHRQQHKYRKETRRHYETYMLTMAIKERLGGSPTTTWIEWCAQNNIPEPPSPYAVMTEPPERAAEVQGHLGVPPTGHSD